MIRGYYTKICEWSFDCLLLVLILLFAFVSIGTLIFINHKCFISAVYNYNSLPEASRDLEGINVQKQVQTSSSSAKDNNEYLLMHLINKLLLDRDVCLEALSLKCKQLENVILYSLYVTKFIVKK